MTRAHISDREVMDCLIQNDSNASGLITSKQFAKAMQSCGIDFSDADIQRFMLRFDSEESQTFSLDSFFKFIRGSNGEEVDLDGTGDRPVIKSHEAIETQAWANLRRRIVDKLETGYTSGEVFAYFDPSERGILDVDSLYDGAKGLGVIFTRLQARAILRRMTILAGTAVDRTSFFDALEIDLDGYNEQSKRRAKPKPRRPPLAADLEQSELNDACGVKRAHLNSDWDDEVVERRDGRRALTEDDVAAPLKILR
jgi:Ca2+-binding EF-hand superfamily protein